MVMYFKMENCLGEDNMTMVSYINQQGGLHLHQLHMLAHKLILW